ncbi:MAG TPA: hypothetical protein VKV77_14795 [Methylovirgula sp.]|nr:hypothetical protein [Methylovirgula sp.]
MKKRVALALGGAFIAASIILAALGPPTGAVGALRFLVVVSFAICGPAMQVYALWPRRRQKYFMDEVLIGNRLRWPQQPSEQKINPRPEPAGSHYPRRPVAPRTQSPELAHTARDA